MLNDGSQSARFQGVFVPGKGIRTPYVVLDFGRQVFGFPRVRLEAEAGAILDLTYGQQLINDRLPGALSYADRYIARDGVQTWEAAEYKQFRYLFIAIRSTYSPVHIRSISLNEYTYPAPLRGSFECADPVLTTLWKAQRRHHRSASRGHDRVRTPTVSVCRGIPATAATVCTGP